MSTEPNAAQIDYWNADVGRTWADLQSLLDEQLKPLGRMAMEALALQGGEQLIDIGCGCGDTSLDLARLVGPAGWITGVDISEPMLARARARTEGLSNFSFLEADAQSHRFTAGAFDAAFSRFGVMFFADPALAFSNIARALKPGGRLAFVCWRRIEDNPWMSAPSAAVADLLPPPLASDPLAPGPFAFADAGRVRDILSEAGFSEIDILARDDLIGVSTLEGQTALALKVGPLGSALRQNPDLTKAVVPRVRECIARYMTPDGARLPASVWIVSAKV